MSKPTALAAFAAKQQRVELRDNISKPETGRPPGRNLAQLKASSLEALGDAGTGGANRGQLKELAPLRGGTDSLSSPSKPLKLLNELRAGGNGRGPPRKLVEVASTITPMLPSKLTEVDGLTATSKTELLEPRSATVITTSSPHTVKAQRGSSLKPLAPTDDSNQEKRSVTDNPTTDVDPVENEKEEQPTDNVSLPATDSSPAQEEKTGPTDSVMSTIKPSAGNDKSDAEDVNFEDSGDEKDGLDALKPPRKDEEVVSSLIKIRPVGVDVDDLYDCPPVCDPPSRQEREPQMFLPRASNIELFHVVLAEDTARLEEILEDSSPQEILNVIDITGRTLYHYAALSNNKLVRDMIFQHVNTYRDTQFEVEMKSLMQKQAQMNEWMERSQTAKNGWVPPRVKELQRETTRQKCADWTTICNAMDENGRSLFHYIATTKALIPVTDDYEFCSALRAKSSILSAKDGFKKLALHYAAESGNLKQVKWYFQMGVKLSQADVDLLLSFNLSRVMESTILRQLEAIDIQNYHFPTSMHNIDENDECYDPGVSTFVLVKLQRVTDDTAGRLHQLPLHRATMFGNIWAVELLLEEGADPNARDANRWTPLHYCADEATSNHLAIAQLLMENSKMVDIDARSLKGRSPLHVAARSKKRKMLCDENVSPSAEECEANRRKLFVDYLIEHGANLDLKDSRGSTPLLLACQSDYVGVIKSLLDAGCDPTIVSDNKWNPLHLAVIQGKPSMVLFLMSWDADLRLWINSIDQQGRKPIDITKNDCTRQMLMSLWTECYNGTVERVKRLLLSGSKRDPQAPQQNFYVSVRDKTEQTRRTPLHLAILGYIDVLQSTEASTLPAPSRGRHPKQANLFELKRTAPGRFLQVAVLLLQAGADLCAGDKWGITPLMLAATINDSIFMETLLDRLPDENDLIVVDEDGNTALHYSYAFCQAQVSTVLEDQMDDSDIENKQGKSPFEMTGYHDKIYPKAYREFLRRQQEMRNRQGS